MVVGNGKKHIPIWNVGFPRALKIDGGSKWLPHASLPHFLLPQVFYIW